jgi:hypothetical protein
MTELLQYYYNTRLQCSYNVSSTVVLQYCCTTITISQQYVEKAVELVMQ